MAWVVILLTLGAVAALMLVTRPRHADVVLGRRRFLVCAALGAASLCAVGRRFGLSSLFAEDDGPTKLSVLGRLGDVWRSMSRHASGAVNDREAWDALERRMEKALAQLEALKEDGGIGEEIAAALAAAFRERHAHVYRIRYFMATCYKMTMLGGDMSNARHTIERQVETLNKLAEEGKLTKQAEEKARAAIAKEVAFQTRLRQLQYGPDGTGDYENPPREQLTKLDEDYRGGKIKPTPASQAAAKALVDFTANR
ncbi:MAG: hypothetical protein ACE5R4_13130, partial [Armatimonadota bacterium]